MLAVLSPCRVLGLVCPQVSQIASFRQLDHRLIGGEVAAVLGNLAQLVTRSLDRVGGGGTSHEVGER